MKILEEKIPRGQLLNSEFIIDGPMVKAVVDLGKKIVAVDAEMHADMEQMLLGQGSRQDDLWGINLYPEVEGDDFVEFDSMINLRPRQGNFTRGVDNPEHRQQIIEVVHQWII